MSQLNDQLMALKAREQTLLTSEFDLEEEQKQAGMGHSANEVKRSVKIHSPHSHFFHSASFPVSTLSHSHSPLCNYPL